MEQYNVVYIIQQEIILLTCMYFYKILFLSSIHFKQTFTTHSLRIHYAFNYPFQILRTCYACFTVLFRRYYALILHRIITVISPCHHRNTTVISQNGWWMRTECVANAYWMFNENILGKIVRFLIYRKNYGLKNSGSNME